MTAPAGSASPRLLVRRLAALPMEARWLFLGTFINRFGSFVLVFLVVWMRDLGFSEVQAGLAVSSYGAGAIATTAVAGLLADRIGRRRTIAVSMFSSAVTLLALGQARSLGAVVVLAALAGATAELYRPASTALLSDLVEEADRVVAFTGYRFAINLGFAMGPAAAGFLAGRSMWLLFVGDALTATAFGVIALAVLPHGVTSRRGDEARGEGTRTMLADRRLLLLLASSVLGAAMFQQAFSTFALHVEAAGLAERDYGLLISLNGLLIVLLEVPLVGFNQHRSPPRLMALGLVVSGIGWSLTSTADTLPLLALTVGVWTMGEIIGAPFASAHLQNIAPAHLRGRYAAAVGLAFGVAGVLAPTVGAWLFSVDPTVLWLGTGLIAFAAAALVLASERAQRPATGAQLPNTSDSSAGGTTTS